MKQTERERILPAERDLDAELAEMAEEIPPMPADFHDRWMKAVRAEAEDESAPAESAPAGGTDAQPRREAGLPARRTRILSIAAVFVFLIGGTILYRSSGKTLSPALRKEAQTEETAEEEDIAAEEDAAAPEPLYAMRADTYTDSFANNAYPADGAALPLAAGAAPEEAETEETAEEDAGTPAEEAAEEKAAGPGVLATGAPTEPVPDKTEDAFEGAAGAAPEEAETEATAEEDTETEEEPEENEEADGRRETEDREASGRGFLREAGDFLTDMGAFLLAALPYLLVLAVPAAAAVIIRVRKRKTGRK